MEIWKKENICNLHMRKAKSVEKLMCDQTNRAENENKSTYHTTYNIPISIIKHTIQLSKKVGIFLNEEIQKLIKIKANK